MSRIVDTADVDAWIEEIQGASRAAFSEILAEGCDRAAIEALARELFRRLGAAADEIARITPARRLFACHKGCSACCHAFIQSTPLYTLAAFLHAAKHCPPDQRARQRQRALTRHRPCPFLEERACQIYPARPPVCRYYFSYDADWCAIDRCCVIDARDADEGMRHRLLARASFAIERAAVEALASVGLTAEPHALDAGIRILLNRPAALERWLGGEAVFVEAVTPFTRHAFDWQPPLHGLGHGPEQGVIPAP